MHEFVVTADEIPGSNIKRGCHKRAGLDLGRRCKTNTAGINEEKDPVGDQRTRDGAGARPMDTAEDSCGTGRLNEIDRFILRDIEGSEVDDRAVIGSDI